MCVSFIEVQNLNIFVLTFQFHGESKGVFSWAA